MSHTNNQRLTTAIHSLEEYLQDVWQGDEGIQAIIDSLRIVEQEHAACDELRKIAKAFGTALDMSDSEHSDFRDSNADVVEYLWHFEMPVRKALAKLAGQLSRDQEKPHAHLRN